MNLNDCTQILQLTHTLFNFLSTSGNPFISDYDSFKQTKSSLDHKFSTLSLTNEIEMIHTISKQIDYLLETQPTHTEVFWNTLNSYKYQLTTFINQYLVTQLSLPQTLTPSTAQALFSLYASNLFTNEQLGILYFLTARLISAAAPQLSYEYTIKAFETFPSLTKRFSPAIDYIYEPVEEELTPTCPICGNTDAFPFFNAQIIMAPNFSPNFSPSKLWQACPHCHNLFAYNFPRDLSLDTTYKLTQPDFLNEPFLVPRLSLSFFSHLINTLESYHSGNCYLEVGVGTGEFIAVALEMSLDIHAIEILPSLCQQTKELFGIDVHCDDFLNFDTLNKYDVITMGDVIEHIKQPVLALQKAHALLNKNGLLWISTPNYTSSFSRMMKFADPMWIEPWHYTYFSSNSFLSLLTATGFKILEYNVSQRYNGSMEIIAQKL